MNMQAIPNSISALQSLGAQNIALQSLGAQNIPDPQPTDMQTHLQRAQEVAKRLDHVHARLIAIVGRLYGEGASGEVSPDKPRSVGLSHEMTGALSDIEAISDKLFQAASRLSSFA